MKIPAIKKQEPLSVTAGVSKLSKIEFERNPFPGLLKEPANFWDEIFIANEASMLAGITHPRIRRKLAYDTASHRLFLEYVDADTLQELVQSGETLRTPHRTHQILQSVAETMADLHAGVLCERPIVHNDLKSMNVLVSKHSPNETILIDFTHAYFASETPPKPMDKNSNPVGTAKYMAPEKWDGNYASGFKSDVFAFGVLAYYTYTGKYPFDGDLADIEQQIRELNPLSPIELGSNILRTTLVTTMACLEKKPERRPTMEYIAKCYADAANVFL